METLLEQTNPHGTMRAIVEHDGRVMYMYLQGHPAMEFGMRAVWLRNLEAAPQALDAAAMEKGEPPLMPVAHCQNPAAQEPPSELDLRVVWLPEGNGVALYEEERLWAVIPPWSGHESFKGYCEEAKGEGPLAWALADDNALHARFDEAKTYWLGWKGDFGANLRKAQFEIVEQVLGKPAKVLGIDNRQWPPRALAVIPRDGATVFVTVGVAARPQPNVELSTDEPGALARIELGLVLPREADEDEIKKVATYLAGVSAYPWQALTWLGAGHTLPCGMWADESLEWALLVPDHPGLPEVTLEPVLGDPVNLLWLLPISEADRDRAEGESADALLAELPQDRWTKG